jgi:hypothetical protein
MSIPASAVRVESDRKEVTEHEAVRVSGGEVLMTDGPYVEGKEHLGGLSIINAADLDAALAVGRRLAEITSLPIEVRPFQSGAAIH